MKHHESISYRIFIVFVYIMLVIILLATLGIFFHILSVAFSNGVIADANKVSVYPKGLTLAAFKHASGDSYIGITLLNSFWRLLIGVGLNLILMVLTAYPLSKSKDQFPLRNVYSMILVFTMMFTGGLVPNYLLIKNLNMMDSIWALVLPMAIPVNLCVILMNFFRGLPKEIDEAAAIDGASYFQRLVRIALPLAMPALATVATFAIINHWNAWFDGSIYMRRAANYPYSTYLRYMVLRLDSIQNPEEVEYLIITGTRPLKMAYVLISIIPVFIVYPFLQRYIKAGLTIGSVKG